jgi:hypothetical protein
MRNSIFPVFSMNRSCAFFAAFLLFRNIGINYGELDAAPVAAPIIASGRCVHHCF